MRKRLERTHERAFRKTCCGCACRVRATLVVRRPNEWGARTTCLSGSRSDRRRLPERSTGDPRLLANRGRRSRRVPSPEATHHSFVISPSIWPDRALRVGEPRASARGYLVWLTVSTWEFTLPARLVDCRCLVRHGAVERPASFTVAHLQTTCRDAPCEVCAVAHVFLWLRCSPFACHSG